MKWKLIISKCSKSITKTSKIWCKPIKFSYIIQLFSLLAIELEKYADLTTLIFIIKIIVWKFWRIKKRIKNLKNPFILRCSGRKRKLGRKKDKYKKKLSWRRWRQMNLISFLKSAKGMIECKLLSRRLFLSLHNWRDQRHQICQKASWVMPSSQIMVVSQTIKPIVSVRYISSKILNVLAQNLRKTVHF